MNRNDQSRERQLSSELMEKIQQRWGIVYRAVDNEHAAELAYYPNLLEEPEIPAEPVQLVDATPIAGNVIDMASWQEQRDQQHLGRLRQLVDRAHQEDVPTQEINYEFDDAA